MTKPARSAACLLSMLSTLALLAGCAPGDTESEPTAPEGPHRSVGSFVMHVRPAEQRAEIRRIPADMAGKGPLSPQAITSLPIVSDDITGSGPANTVELATLSTENTYNAAATQTCAANSFCGDVQFMHFFSGLSLSAVYIQITAITDTNGNIDSVHKATNGVSSTPFGIDTSLGVWQHTPLPGSVAASTAATQKWAFANPDNADFYVYLDAKAALYPTLWFGKTGLTQTATPVAGKPFTLHYEYARNTGCSGPTSFTWNTFLKATNTDLWNPSFANQSGGTFYDVEIVTPFGGGMDLWFNKDTGSCQSWDSNGGSNYNVGISNPLPAIHFGGPSSAQNPYWTTNLNIYADSGVKAGATFTVDYEPDRISCLHLDRYRRLPAGTWIKMGYAFSSDNINYTSYTEVDITGTPYGVPTAGNGVTGPMVNPPSVAIPAGSKSMKVYFYTNASTCTYPSNYDSNFAQNWYFGNL